MTITVRATYEGGVLRPARPLALAEGETVELTIAPTELSGKARRSPTPEEEDYARRIMAAPSLDEMLAVLTTAPPLPDGYDLCQALNANRQASGERLLFSEPADGLPSAAGGTMESPSPGTIRELNP